MKEFSTVNPNKVTIAENLTGQFRCKYKGYGFITKKDTNEDIFVPFIGIKKLENDAGNVNLKPGDDVEFDIISQDGKEIAWNVTKIRKNDKLFEQIDVEIKAHQPDVLKSYSFFATQAANALDINILESWPEPEPHKVRKTLLRSAFVVKKSRVQYEFRYYLIIYDFNQNIVITIHATGIAGGKGFRCLCRLPAAKQNRQRKMEKFALYTTKIGHNF